MPDFVALNLDALETYLMEVGEHGEARLEAYKVQALVDRIRTLEGERDAARTVELALVAEAWHEGREAARELVFDYDVDQAISALDNPYERPLSQQPPDPPAARTIAMLSCRLTAATEACRAAIPLLLDAAQDLVNNNAPAAANLWREGSPLPQLEKFVAREVNRHLVVLKACRAALGQSHA